MCLNGGQQVPLKIKVHFSLQLVEGPSGDTSKPRRGAVPQGVAVPTALAASRGRAVPAPPVPSAKGALFCTQLLPLLAASPSVIFESGPRCSFY